MMMCKSKTEKEITNMAKRPDDNAQLRAKKLFYFIKNCSSYVVTPKGNEHWLCGYVILTHWAHDTGYSRKYYGLACPDNFESWSFHNDIIAGETFETHHARMEEENNG